MFQEAARAYLEQEELFGTDFPDYGIGEETALNEIRNIIIGFELGEKESQICYYDRKAGEAVSMALQVGTSQYTFPTILSKKPDRWLAVWAGGGIFHQSAE